MYNHHFTTASSPAPPSRGRGYTSPVIESLNVPKRLNPTFNHVCVSFRESCIMYNGCTKAFSVQMLQLFCCHIWDCSLGDLELIHWWKCSPVPMTWSELWTLSSCSCWSYQWSVLKFVCMMQSAQRLPWWPCSRSTDMWTPLLSPSQTSILPHLWPLTSNL